MASILKNQIFKHLSKFTKGLSTDKINLSTFKGEGELSNLELDENILTDLLELPSWLRITNAWCDKVSFRVQWTQLKSVPIHLVLGKKVSENEKITEMYWMSDSLYVKVEGGSHSGEVFSLHKPVSGLTTCYRIIQEEDFRGFVVIEMCVLPATLTDKVDIDNDESDFPDSLNKVLIAVETCEELRSTSCVQGLSSYAGAAKYGFIHKVIDGVTVTVNTVKITFKSPAFVANVELTRIIVQSKSRDWQDCKLPASRLKDVSRGQVLLFKELEWHDARIEAKSTKDPNLTPLRLITNKARCRITLKKKLLDSSILGSRLAIILDDLLWVLTDFQLKAALHFIDSLVGLIQKATEVTRKKKAARKLETLPEYQAQQSQSTRNKEPASPLSRTFEKYDVIETSYHFQAQKIDLHFSDDPSAGRSCHPELQNGGAFQVSLKKFRVDYYPYHLAVAERYHWATYKPAATPHTEWLRQAQSVFINSLLSVVENAQVPSNSSSQGIQQNDDEKSRSGSGKQSGALKSEILKQMNKLMTSCIILRISDFNMYQVTTSCVKKHIPKEFISGDKDRYSLPEPEAVVHAEFTYYYFPGDDPFPLPTPKFYVHLNPIQIHFDVISLLWANAFALNLHQSLLQTKTSQGASGSDLMYFDVKIEAILPRVILESPIDYPGQKDRPKSLHLQVSRATITNVRSMDRSSRADLEKCVDLFQMCSLFFNGEFPSSAADFPLVTQKFVDHFSASDNVRPHPPQLNATELKSQLKRELLWTEAKDVWCIHLEPVFGDFFGTRAVGKEFPVPFLDAFPLTLWVYLKMPGFGKPEPETTKDSGADIHVLAHVSTLVSLQINHYQYLFLLRLFEEAKELATYLSLDSNRITKSVGGSMVVGGVLPELEITFVMPSQSPGKESSGGDVESVIPDSSSLQDAPHWQSNSSVPNVNNPTLGRCQTSVSDFSMDTQKISFEPPPVKTVNGNAKSPSSFATGKSMSLDYAQPQHSENPLSFISSIKKGFDKMMTSIDVGPKTSPEDMSDNVSMRSDMSSDSETFIVLGNEYSGGAIERFKDGMESLFHVNLSGSQLQPVEVATDVLEEENTLTSPSERDSSTCGFKRRDLVSVSTFKFCKVEFQQQSEGLSSAVKVQISNIGVEDCSSISWDEFQTKFSSRSRDWVEVPLDAGVHPKIKVRLNHLLVPDPEIVKETPLVDRSHVLKWFENTANVKVESVNLSLNTSSLTGLVDLLEDEMTPTPFPVTVDLEDIKLRIVEDRPPCNITSPEPLPINLVVSRLTINRLASGLIEIQPYKSLESDKSQNTDSSTDTGSNGSRLQMENEELRRRLSVLEGLSKENYRLKRYQQDAENMSSRLRDALNEIDVLLQNKKNLLDRITALENQYQMEKNSKR